MDPAIALLEERLAKAQNKAARAEKAWESAKNEVSDLATALRVMRELAGESDAPSVGANALVADRQRMIVNMLPVGEPRAVAPAELFEAYKLLADEEISIDTFRTTIWRMKDRTFVLENDMWLVKGENGRYWKEPGTFGTRARHETEEYRASLGFGGDDSEAPF